MKLSIVIPCYNAARTLALQLEALSNQRWSEPWEIVLVDNRSTDNSRQIAEDYRDKLPNLRIVDASKRSGAAFATNVGIKAASGECLALCDADDEVGDGWVAAMGEALARHDFVACRIDTSRLNPPWLRGHEQEYGLQTIWYPPWLPHAGGGTMGFTRSMFNAVGGFDDHMRHLQDTEFCFRAQMQGYTIHFVLDAVVHVRRRSSLMEHYRQSRNYAEYNVILAKRYWRRGVSSRRFYARFIGDWLCLLRRPMHLRTRVGRYSWVWRYGQQIGRLKGLLGCYGVPV